MIVTPKDITSFLFCPYIINQDKVEEWKKLVYPPLTNIEKKIRNTWIFIEQNQMVKNRNITISRINTAWEKIFWSSLSSDSLENAKESTNKINKLLISYAKFNYSEDIFNTLGTKITIRKDIGNFILETKIDVIKTDLTKKKNTIILDFGRKDINNFVDIVPDFLSKIICYSIYTGKGEEVKYVSVNINENNDNLIANEIVIKPEEIKKIEKTIEHVLFMIGRKVLYQNSWNCERCNLCNFRSLIQKDIL